MIRPERIGHVVIKVRDLERSKRFYTEVLGLRQMGEIQRPPVAFFSAGGRDHHEIAVLEVGPDAPDADQRAVGLVHIAFRLTSRDQLVSAYHELKEKNVPIHFTVDHGVTESVYFMDPDGNELEVYVDNPIERQKAMENPYSGMQKLDFAPDDPGLADLYAEPPAK